MSPAPPPGFQDVFAMDQAQADSVNASSVQAGKTQGGMIIPGAAPLINTGDIAGQNVIRANQVAGGKGEPKSFSPVAPKGLKD